MTDIIEIIKYIFLGLFQGFTEPIPISSSGHLVIARNLINVDITGITFEGFINFGSLMAVLIIYRKDLASLAVNGSRFLFQKDKNYKSDFFYLFLLVIATIPAGVIGVLFKDVIEETISSDSVKIVGATLFITGIALWIIRNLKGHKNDSQITIKDAIIVGLAQAVALMPGISRSGATVVAAMLLGMKRESALRFSFLLYIPVSVGTMIFSVGDIVNDSTISSQLPLYIIALIAAFIASYFALLWFLNVMKSGKLKYFAIYCFIVGPLVFFLL